MSANEHMEHLLEQRRSKGILRSLQLFSEHLIDFCSNDYLGFSRSGKLVESLTAQQINERRSKSGSGGSRLLSGNSAFSEELEHRIAAFHHAESALIFNSGYDANLGFYSCVPQKNDLVLYDELVHASILDGIRLSYAEAVKFRHNDASDLLEKFKRKAKKYSTVFVAIESLYSMNGDIAPLVDFSDLCEQQGWNLCVDEAHATGVFGKNGSGLCVELGIEKKCFARLYTYGKAFGAHGAAITGSSLLKKYLINFSRSFIYSTALPEHSLQLINAAYQLSKFSDERNALFENITFFTKQFSSFHHYSLQSSPIQIIRIPGNEFVSQAALYLQQNGFDIRAVKSPTVPPGKECLRVCLHAFNSREEIIHLYEELKNILQYQER